MFGKPKEGIYFDENDGLGGGPPAPDTEFVEEPEENAPEGEETPPVEGEPPPAQTVSLDDYNALKEQVAALQAQAAPAETPPAQTTQTVPALNPYQQALKEASEQTNYPDQDWINNRMWEIQAERQSQQNETAFTAQLAAAQQAYPAQLKAHFAQQGEAEPDTLVKDVMSTLDFFGVGSFAHTKEAATARQIAVDAALWRREQRLKKADGAGKNGSAGADPVTGASSSGGAVPKDAQKFVREWEQTHNGGKRATAAQIEHLKREHPYAMRAK